jgi:endonuclease/exonuclease/phosphatase family metal-dependent hydrolase
MWKFIGTVFKIVNVFAILFYLSACLIPFLPAGKFWIFAVAGLFFPLAVVLMLCFLVGWLIVKNRQWGLLCLIVLLPGWQQISVMAGFNSKKAFNYAKKPAMLRVLQWNVSSWGLSNKSQLPQTNYGPLTVALIKEQQADIICFQEFLERKDWYSKELNLQAFKQMGYPYSYFVKSVNESGELKSGVVIVSRYPITDTATYFYGEYDAAEHLIYADVQVQQQKIRIFTTHLQSVQFNNGEYTAVTKIKKRDKEGLKDTRTIIHKLKYAYTYRQSEAELVHQKISESPYPVIICGDFNDVPNSYTYFKIRGNLQDAFVKKGTGFGRTFQYLSPTLRIDYILADKKFGVAQYRRIKVPYSDHYPIVADLVIDGMK